MELTNFENFYLLGVSKYVTALWSLQSREDLRNNHRGPAIFRDDLVIDIKEFFR